MVGYVAYIEFLNGFSKTFYMDKDEMERHAMKYSQSYKKGFGVWKDNFDAMALKTVLKLLISKYGIMSIEMESSNLARAIAADQAIVDEDDTYTYADNDNDVPVTVEAQEPPQHEIDMNDIPNNVPPIVEDSQPGPAGNNDEECPF